MNQRTLELLEFDKILARLATKAGMPLAKSLALNPCFYPLVKLMEVQEETEAGLIHGRSLGWPGFPDFEIHDSLQKAQPKESCLPLEEISLIADWCLGIKRLVDYKKQAASSTIPRTLLNNYFSLLDPHSELTKEIRKTISPEGEIYDSASPKLSEIRTRIKNLTSQIQNRLGNLLADSSHQAVWQERIITIRDGRHVLPVKSGQLGQIKGIILDRSATGETVFIEPEVIIGLGNSLREQELALLQEIRKILISLTNSVRKFIPGLERTRQIAAELDLVFARARLSDELKASRPDFVTSNEELKIMQARHPLLTCEIVPIDIIFRAGQRALVITGPNTGGKTVALKTLGLFVLMAQAGLFIPAKEGSSLRWFEDVWCEIGDDQSIQDNLSTYSAHIKTLSMILKKAKPSSLILIDEIGTGTDPREGSALGIAILETFLKRAVNLAVTTHYGDIKNFAYTSESITIAAVRFNEISLMPEYQLDYGVPGNSHAFTIAKQLGLEQEIIDRATSLVPKEVRTSEAMFRRIEEELSEARNKKLAAEKAWLSGSSIKEQYQNELKKFRAERKTLIEETQEKMKTLVRQVELELEGLLKKSKALVKPPNAREKAELINSLKSIKAKIPVQPESFESRLDEEPPTNLKIGDRAYVTSLGSEGEVLEIEGEFVKLALGSFQTKAKLRDLRYLAKAKPRGTEFKYEVKSSKALSSIDLRGMRAQEAEEKLTKYLDQACLAELSEITIIHGKGTGSLRQITQDILRKHPMILEREPTMKFSGGGGATSVSFSDGLI